MSLEDNVKSMKLYIKDHIQDLYDLIDNVDKIENINILFDIDECLENAIEMIEFDYNNEEYVYVDA